LSNVEASLRNLPAKVKGEEDRREFGQFVYKISSRIEEVVAFIKLKASKLQDYNNVR